MRRFAPTRALTADADAPIADLNITPLIDVMLVLLVVFLMSLPALTHEVPLDLPQPNPDPAKPLAMHRLELTRSGALRLDGAAVDDATLTARLAPIATDPQSSLVMRTDPEARYERFDQTLATVKRAGITRLGFEGNRAL
jgi:biopolymer transport protein ExbD